MERKKLMQIKGDGFLAEVYDRSPRDDSAYPGIVYVDIRKDGDASDEPFAEGFIGSSIASAYSDDIDGFEIFCNCIIDDFDMSYGVSEGDEDLWETVRSWWRAFAKEALEGMGETTEVEFSGGLPDGEAFVAKVGIECGWTIDFFRKKDGTKVAAVNLQDGFEIDPENDATAKEIACISGWLLKAATKNDPFPSMHTALNVFGTSKLSKEFSARAEADFQARMSDVRTNGQQQIKDKTNDKIKRLVDKHGYGIQQLHLGD